MDLIAGWKQLRITEMKDSLVDDKKTEAWKDKRNIEKSIKGIREMVKGII